LSRHRGANEKKLQAFVGKGIKPVELLQEPEPAEEMGTGCFEIAAGIQQEP
jgi:hypothetical protein